MIYIYYIYILKLCGMLLFWTIVTKATELEEKKNRFFLFLVRVPQEHLSTFPASRFNSRSSRERLGKSFKGNTFCASAAKWKTSVSVRTGPKEQVQKWWIDPSFFAGFSGENVVLSILSHGIWFFSMFKRTDSRAIQSLYGFGKVWVASVFQARDVWLWSQENTNPVLKFHSFQLLKDQKTGQDNEMERGQ